MLYTVGLTTACFFYLVKTNLQKLNYLLFICKFFGNNDLLIMIKIGVDANSACINSGKLKVVDRKKSLFMSG
jgi:hypothetical protein